jgi:hypothetical protein
MKKVLSITNVVIINLVLLTVFRVTFNPFDLPLLELKYFNGFNLINLFSPDPVVNILLVLSVVGLITFNYKVFKK